MKQAYSKLAGIFYLLMNNAMPVITAITLADSISPPN